MLRARLAFAAAILSLAAPSFASITGTVMDHDGRPIAGARVAIYAVETLDARRTRLLSKTPERTPISSATSDSKGSFSLTSPKEAVVDLRAEAKGFGLDQLRVERDDDAVTIMLPTAPAKQGTVTANGKPVAGATVMWLGIGTESLATTDAAGHYSVADPVKWASRLVILHPDYAVVDQLYGGPRKAELDQRLDPGVAITGKVVGADGTTPLAGATITLESLPLAKSGDDGSFSIAHAPKKWELIEARVGDRVGVRANNSKSAAIKLGPTGSLSGVVRDAKTQQPIALAEVRLSRASAGTFRFIPDTNAISAFTDAKGVYTLVGIRAGSFDIAASRPGYAPSSVATTVAASQKVQRSISAIPQARISGTIVDEDKRPVAGAIVNANAVSRDGGPPNFMNFGGRNVSPASGPDGRFVVTTSREGDIVVEATKKGYPPAKTPPFRITAGERKGGLVLTIPRGIAVTGHVIDVNGRPVSGVTVVGNAAEQGQGAGMRRMMVNFASRNTDDDTVQTASDGTFTLHLKEGMYDLAFRREGFAPKSVRAQQVNASIRPIEVKLDAGVEISGIVTRSGNPIADVNVGVIGNDVQTFGTTTPDGRFTITDLTPGSYMLIVNKQEDFIQQMRTVSAPAKDVAIDLPPGGRVTGHVVDKNTHQPVTSFQAGVSTSRSGGGMAIMTPPMLKSFTSDDGSFALDNVPVGNTQVIANAPGYTTGRVPSVVVEEGKTTENIEVALDTGVKLSGRVTGSDGAALAGVTIRPDGNDRIMRMAMADTTTTTDSNGEYALDALEPGEKAFNFSRSGYLSESKTVSLSSKETRLDVQLSSGIRITGVVTTEAAAPVADASVRATSAATTGFGRSTRTDASGGFMFEGVAPGHYNFTASKDGYADAISRDIEAVEGTPVRLALKTGGIVAGHVTGIADADLASVTINIRSSLGGATEVPVDQAGNFRAEGAPTGTLRITADLMKGFTERRSSDVKTVELAPGGSVQVDLEFNTQTIVRGHVTRNGASVAGAAVQFYPRQGSTASTNSRVSTDDKGNYAASGLADGPYSVSVIEPRLSSYSTTYDVHGSGNFDIDIKSSTLRGRVLDSGSGDPIVEATVQLRTKSTDAMASMISQRNTTTDANGVFVMESVAAGSYTATADKEGYGSGKNDVSVGDNAPPDIELRLSKNDGVLLKVVDARDGRALAAQVVLYDGAGQIAYDQPMMMGGSGPDPVRIPVPAGQYRAVVSASGYASQSTTVVSPSRPTVALTPGGTLFIHSTSSGLQRARLVSSSGMIYSRPFNRDGVFGVSGALSQVMNVQPGAYKLEILGAGGSVTKSVEVVIVEGQVTNVDV
jgi:protocatechuate 3,4-dioxygenase beta subunit